MPTPQPSPGAPAPVVVEIVVRYGDRVVDVRHVSDDRYVIGEGPEAHLTVQLPPSAGAGVPLIIALVDQAVLGLVAGMTGEVVRGEQTIALAELLAQGRKSYALTRGDRCEAALGGLRFSITTVEPAAFVPARRPVDRLYWASNTGATLLIGALIVLGQPHAPGELEVEEVAASRERAIRYLTDIPPPPPPPERPAPPSVQKTRTAARPATPPASPPPPEAAPLLAAPATGPAKIAPKGSRRGIRNDYDYARTAGFLNDDDFNKSIAEFTASSQEGVLSYADTPEMLAFWDGVAKAPPRNRGFGGLELAETERGGGVHGERKRTPAGSGKAVLVNTGKAGPGPTAEQRAIARRVVTIRFETPYIQGDMLADDVQTALRKQSGGLSRCYKGAVGSADIRGTVLFRLKVNAGGRVTSAGFDFGSSKFGDIGPCITAAARAWRLPPTIDHKPATVAVEALISATSH